MTCLDMYSLHHVIIVKGLRTSFPLFCLFVNQIWGKKVNNELLWLIVGQDSNMKVTRNGGLVIQNIRFYVSIKFQEKLCDYVWAGLKEMKVCVRKSTVCYVPSKEDGKNKIKIDRNWFFTVLEKIEQKK